MSEKTGKILNLGVDSGYPPSSYVRGRKSTKTEDAVVIALMDKQDKGYKKYGFGIDSDMYYDWCDEVIEELADGLQYAVAMKERRDKTADICKWVIEHIRTYGNEIDMGAVEQALDDMLYMLGGYK